jgi:hypothetical protein
MAADVKYEIIRYWSKEDQAFIAEVPDEQQQRRLHRHGPLREANSSRLPSSTMPASRSSGLMPCRPSAALRL